MTCLPMARPDDPRTVFPDARPDLYESELAVRFRPGTASRASMSLSANLYLNVLGNSCNRMYLRARLD